MTATKVAVPISPYPSKNLQGMFFIPLTAATVLGIISSLPLLGLKEKKSTEKPDLKQHFFSDIFSVLKYARKNPDFVK